MGVKNIKSVILTCRGRNIPALLIALVIPELHKSQDVRDACTTGQRIQIAAHIRGIDRHRFHEKTGGTMYMAARMNNPSQNSLLKICAALGLTIQDLYDPEMKKILNP